MRIIDLGVFKEISVGIVEGRCADEIACAHQTKLGVSLVKRKACALIFAVLNLIRSRQLLCGVILECLDSVTISRSLLKIEMTVFILCGIILILYIIAVNVREEEEVGRICRAVEKRTFNSVIIRCCSSGLDPDLSAKTQRVDDQIVIAGKIKIALDNLIL